MANDEQTQAVFYQIRHGSYDTQLAAARVIVAAQDYIGNKDGPLTLNVPLLGALRLSLIEYEQEVNPPLPVPEVD